MRILNIKQFQLLCLLSLTSKEQGRFHAEAVSDVTPVLICRAEGKRYLDTEITATASRAVPLSERCWSQRATSFGCHPAQSFAGGLSEPWKRNIPVPGQHPCPRHRLARVSSAAASLLCVNRGLVNLAYFSSPKHFLDTSKILKTSKQTKTNRLGNIKADFFYPCLIDPRVQRFL